MVILERAKAKITLSLDVLGKRDDGYHDVEMVMTTIDFSDRLELYPLTQDRIEVTADNQYVPNDERNLAYKAAHELKKIYQIPYGVRIDIQKKIPVSAGLGGGSSDAAAVLRGLNRLWGLQLSLYRLAEIGSYIGSDVPFCIYGATALVSGRGEKVQKLSSPPSCWVVLAKPDIGVSTRNVFRHIDMNMIHHPDTDGVLRAISEKSFYRLSDSIGNALEEITFQYYPETKRVKEKMMHYGISGVLMSGSGPTIFGLVEQQSKARRVYNGLRGFCREVYMVRMIGV
ncbi:MAG TPA: 4-(cytidine 5'-diphospho)-2-C-methyl-D-erythritol kinase [Virgibacillus sp.]|nr:4-(cytidine 5'-diphospho)-2-C-methyl-D-erythritol kinase [Virgibacillus sp.]